MAGKKKVAAAEAVEAEVLNEYEVTKDYAGCSSFLFNCVEVKIVDGKVTVSAETAAKLKENGLIK